MKIWVDADACPVVIKEILFRAAQRTGVPVTLVANQPISIPKSSFINFIQVTQGFDVADNESPNYNGFTKGVSWQPSISMKKTTFVNFDGENLIDDYAYLAAVPDRLHGRPRHAQDGHLRRVDDGREARAADATEIRDGEGATLHVGG